MAVWRRGATLVGSSSDDDEDDDDVFQYVEAMIVDVVPCNSDNEKPPAVHTQSQDSQDNQDTQGTQGTQDSQDTDEDTQQAGWSANTDDKPPTRLPIMQLPGIQKREASLAEWVSEHPLLYD